MKNSISCYVIWQRIFRDTNHSWMHIEITKVSTYPERLGDRYTGFGTHIMLPKKRFYLVYFLLESVKLYCLIIF